jgi:hypothetical protein
VPLFVAFDPDERMRADFPRIDDAAHPVGTLRAGGEFTPRETFGADVHIELDASGVVSTNRSRFLVRAPDVATCVTARRRPPAR